MDFNDLKANINGDSYSVDIPISQRSLNPKFDKWLEDNRWFTYSPVTKLWSYTFEHGTSISKETREKNYMKTTEELYELFLKTL